MSSCICCQPPLQNCMPAPQLTPSAADADVPSTPAPTSPPTPCGAFVAFGAAAAICCCCHAPISMPYPPSKPAGWKNSICLSTSAGTTNDPSTPAAVVVVVAELSVARPAPRAIPRRRPRQPRVPASAALPRRPHAHSVSLWTLLCQNTAGEEALPLPLRRQRQG